MWIGRYALCDSNDDAPACHATRDVKKSTYVEAIRRFSDPPALDELAALGVYDKDLAEIRQCRLVIRGRGW
jgi:hypothetical protein